MTIGAKGSVAIRVVKDIQVDEPRDVRTIVNASSDSITRTHKAIPKQIGDVRNQMMINAGSGADRDLGAELEAVINNSTYRGSDLSSKSRGSVIGLHSILAFTAMNQTIYTGDSQEALGKAMDEEEEPDAENIARFTDGSGLQFEGIIFSDAKGPGGITRPAFNSSIALMSLKSTKQTRKFISSGEETAQGFGYSAFTDKDNTVLNLNTDNITLSGFLNILSEIFEDVPEMGSAEILTEQMSHPSHKIALGAVASRPTDASKTVIQE